MQGQIIDVAGQQGGLILGDDGNRYGFAPAEWKAAGPPAVGALVDFVASGSFAREIYPLPGAGGFAPGMAAGYPAPNNSSMLGGLGILCLCAGFVIPVLPLIAGLVLGLIGAGTAKRFGDSGGLVLSRVAWIGNLVMLVLAVLAGILIFTVFREVVTLVLQHIAEGRSIQA